MRPHPGDCLANSPYGTFHRMCFGRGSAWFNDAQVVVDREDWSMETRLERWASKGLVASSEQKNRDIVPIGL